jgi:hypothetical protein
MVANCPGKHWITVFERIKDGALGNATFDIKLYLGINLRQGSQMIWKYDTDHFSV